MLDIKDNTYQSRKQEVAFPATLFPSLTFYLQLMFTVLRASRSAQRGEYDYDAWVGSSFGVLQKLEAVGVRIDISGIDNIKSVKGPVVFIGNHMSMMETLILPVMIQPLKNVTFVVKEALLDYPVFKYIMRSRDPIAVTRTNPRQDLKTVMKEGVNRLSNGISVVVFPQTTRASDFDPKQMSSIGVKLAKKADATIIPVALKTDGWKNGQVLKDFGRIDTSMVAYFSFGEPMRVEGKGDSEQQLINEFIAKNLEKWSTGH